MSIFKCYLYNLIELLNFLGILFNTFLVSFFSASYFILFFEFSLIYRIKAFEKKKNQIITCKYLQRSRAGRTEAGYMAEVGGVF